MFSVNTVKLPIVTTFCKLACEQALLFGRVKRGELARWLLSDHRSPISHHQPKTPKLPQPNHYNTLLLLKPLINDHLSEATTITFLYDSCGIFH